MKKKYKISNKKFKGLKNKPYKKHSQNKKSSVKSLNKKKSTKKLTKKQKNKQFSFVTGIPHGLRKPSKKHIRKSNRFDYGLQRSDKSTSGSDNSSVIDERKQIELEKFLRAHEGTGGKLQLSEFVIYNKNGKPLDDDEWNKLIRIRDEDRLDDYLKRLEERRYKWKIDKHKQDIEIRHENRIDREKQRFYELINSGVIYLKDGKFYTNDDRIKTLSNLSYDDNKHKLKQEFIKEYATKKTKEYSNKHSLNYNPRLYNYFASKAERIYNKQERKALKQKYKKNSFELKLQKKHGVLLNKI